MGNQLYDVLIVGAGPAGNIAALESARRGLSVGVVDYRRRIGDKLCTGVIGVECAARFPVPPELIRRDSRSAIIHSPAGRQYRVGRPDPQALVVDRVGYINSIAESARKLGVDYHIGYRADDVLRTTDGMRVFAHDRDTESSFEGRLLLIAAGFGPAFTSTIGLRNGSSHDHLAGAQFSVATRGVEETEVFSGSEVAPGSFGWLVPTRNDEALLGVISRRRPATYLRRLMDRLSSGGAVVGRLSDERRWGIPLKPLSKTFCDRVLMLGDAAGFTKPTTGGGIFYAMLSGLFAAETCEAALDSGDLSEEGLKSYQERWKREFGPELRMGYFARQIYEALDDAQIERVMEVFLSEDVQSELVKSPEFSFDRHGATIMRTIGHRPVASLLREIGPSVPPLMARILKSAIFA